ncbi:hypothetical protein GCM10011498_11490 [Amylibacter cionae]|uniref:Uncharacterized protein n=1 Tax=Neptunicoccus cionae TaxID=2035344 RepID=A0A916QVN0_9RHOB|nr:hypothetical protein GCM10011498_11490 [Amylibacter cionae]
MLGCHGATGMWPNPMPLLSLEAVKRIACAPRSGNGSGDEIAAAATYDVLTTP